VTPNIPSDGFDLDVIDPSDADLPKKLAKSIELASLILLDQKFNAQPRPAFFDCFGRSKLCFPFAIVVSKLMENH